MAGRDLGNETLLHPVGLLAVVTLSILLIFLPRRYAVLPMLLLACFVPSAQRLVLGGLDFTLLRLLVLFGWIRLFVRNEFQGFVWNRLDTFVVAWMGSGFIIYCLQIGTVSALVNRAGWMFDGFGMYFLFRCVVRDWSDLERIAWCFLVVSLPVALAFLLEQSTGRNVFSVFGGVREFTRVREGRLRCQGAFSHPILAGSFWATVTPLMLALWWQGKRWLVGAGLAAAMIIVVACASSTPVFTVLLVLVGMALYHVRLGLRGVRWGFAASLLLLHLIMNNPVWHLMARVGAVGGSTGWHRYRIMDATIRNFGAWALLGEPNPLRWGVEQMNDITNQYILEALRGGLLTLVLFVGVLAVAFGMIGKAVRAYEGNRARQMFVWCVGVMLFAHAGTFFGVSYFGQIIMLVYLTLGMTGSIHSLALVDAEERYSASGRASVEEQRSAGLRGPALREGV